MAFDTDALVVASRRAPELDPHMKVAAVEASVDLGDAMDSAGGMAAFGGALKVRAGLESQDDAIQLRYWRDAGSNMRGVLLAAGYRPPANPEQEDVEHSKRGGIGGWISGAVDTIASPVGNAWTMATNVGEQMVGNTLHAAGAPLRGVQHLYRAAAYMTDDNVSEGRGRWSLHGVFSPGAWAEAWDETKNGEATFSRVEEAEARERWGNDTIDLAKMLASGTSPQEIYSSIVEQGGSAEDVMETFTLINYDPEFRDAYDFMEAAHLSFGRRVIPPELAVTNSALHTALSGGLDALGDWYADPLVIGGKAAKAQRIARFAVRDASDVRHLFAATNTSRAAQAVRREAQQVADILATGGAGDLRALKPRWGRVADDLVQAGVNDMGKLEDWLASKAGFLAMKEGRVTGMHAAEMTMPFQTRFGRATEWAKQNAEKVIDSRAASQKSGSMFIKRFTTAIPRATRINANGAESGAEIGRIARLFLDERAARDIENLWGATKDVGTKRQIYRSTLDHMRQASGIDENDTWWKGIVGALDGSDHAGQIYSPTHLDKMVTGAKEAHEGFLLSHRSTSWVIPSFKEWLRVAGMKQAMGLNSEVMDKVINAWKISVILRPGFAARAVVEELSTAMMRYSPANMAKARMAQSAIKPGNERFMPWHPLQSLFNGMTGHLPPQIRDALRAPGDLMGAVIGDNARRAFRHAEGKLAGERYLNAARTAAESDEYKAMWDRFVSASHQPGGGYLDPVDMGYLIEEGGIVVPAMMKSTAKWGRVDRGTTTYEYAWRQNLDELAHDPVARKMIEIHLKFPGLSLADRRKMMIDEGVGVLGSDAAAAWRNDFRRNFVDRSGQAVGPPTTIGERLADFDRRYLADRYLNEPRLAEVRERFGDAELMDSAGNLTAQFDAVADDMIRWIGDGLRNKNHWVSTTGDHMAGLRAAIVSAKDEVAAGRSFITQEQAWEDWAALTADHTMFILANEAGIINDDIAEKILKGRTPTVVELKNLPDDLKPFHVKGPEMLPITEGEGKLRNFINKSFYEMIGRPMDWMLRQPLMLHNYAVAYDEILAAASKFKFRNQTHMEKYVHDAAVNRAVAESIQYIDDPRLRSQFAVTTRNLMPFWFAQEQFYKRVVRTVLYNPAAVRQTQLIAAGFRHAGITHKDENGDDYFFIPVVGQLTQEFIANAWKLYSGTDVVIPVPVGFTGQVKTITPGLEGIGVPSFAPWVGIAVQGIGDRFPELEPVSSAFAGQYAKRSAWEMFVPSTVARLYHAFADDPDNSQQMMSAEIQAMQYLESTGNGPKDDSPEEYEIWRERVVQWTRSIMVTRAVLGFVSPSPPRLQLDPGLLHKEFIDLIGELGYEEGFREFVKRNPNATPYTVFPTRSESGGPLPVTRAAFRYIEKNRELIDDFPKAGGWLLPTEPGKNSEYSPEAYREQLALEMRLRKPTMTDIWEDIKFAQAKQMYFDTLDARNDALAKAQGDSAAAVERRRQIRQQWTNWAEAYKATHPVFARVLDNPEGEKRRAAVMQDLREATIDPRWPTDKQASHLRTMVDTYDDYRSHVRAVNEGPHPGSNRATALKEQYKAIFLGWATKYIEDNPDVDTFFKMIVLPDVDKDYFD